MPKNLNTNPTDNQSVINRQLLEQFVNDPRTEVTEEELNQILEDELNKPENEMDMQLIDEILEILEPRKVPQEEIEAGWEKLSKKFQAKQKRKNVVIHLRRALIAAAAVVVLFFGSLASARAMRWTFLLKYLEPIAQTFGIYTENRAENNSQQPVYQAEIENTEQIDYSSADEIPDSYDGYRIRLNNVPGRYHFATGSFAKNADVEVFYASYQNEDEWLAYTVQVFNSDEVELGFAYEKSIEEPYTRNVGMKELTFYHNSEDETLSVSWIDKNAYYLLLGNISEEELCAILEGFEKQ